MMIVGQTSAQVENGDKDSVVASPEWSSTWTGPFTCGAVNKSNAPDVAHITTNNELLLNYTPPDPADTSITFTAVGGTRPRTLVGTPDLGNGMTTNNNSSLNSLSWASTKAISAVLVGGSSGNRLYWMPEGAALGTQFSGSGFQNPNGSTITRVAFCYHEPATVTIIKEVLNANNAATTSFPFTSTNLGANNFSLVDNNSIGPDRRIILNLYKFAKWHDYNLTVTESLLPGWSLSDLNCVETDTITVPAQAQFATTVSFSNRRATIRLEEGERVTCTYKNLQIGPSASPGSISGRVINSFNSGVSKAKITVVNASSGATHVVFTNAFGYYTIPDLPVSEFYFVTVQHKRYSFADDTRTFTLNEDLVGLDFVASP